MSPLNLLLAGALGLLCLNVFALQTPQASITDAPADPEDRYYVIVSFEKYDMDMQEVREYIEGFNKMQYASQNLRLAQIYLTAEENRQAPMVIIRHFQDNAAATKYSNTLNTYLKDRPEGPKSMPITQLKYREVLMSKSTSLLDN